MSTYKFNVTLSTTGSGTVSIYYDGKSAVLDQDHPNFTRIVDAIRRNEDPEQIIALCDLQSLIANMDERVKIFDGTVYFDGEAVHNSLSRTILRYHTEGRDTTRLVRFMERLANNPSRRSREQLFDWVQDRELTITEDGYFVGFKGVTDGLTSVNSGTATVDGTEITGQIPNRIGSVVEMPRHLVQDDPDKGCSYGLHVGTYNYASTFGSRLLEVVVDPADVVSVPSHSSYQKLRCCRYQVVDFHESNGDVSRYEPDSQWEYDEDSFDETFEQIAPKSFFGGLKEKIFGRRSEEQ